MAQLALNQIQGIVIRTYGYETEARYFFLTIEKASSAREWLKNILPKVTTAHTTYENGFLNLAFTLEGLRKIGLPEEVLSTFSTDFTTGPLNEQTLRMLGDVEANDPKNWFWGNKDSATKIHLLAMVYAKNVEDLENYCNDLKQSFANADLNCYRTFDTKLNHDMREHFGFRDGIAQPAIEGYGRQDTPENTVKPGEFIFNYPNEYDRYPESPSVDPQYDPQNILPESHYKPGMKDLGAHGSYLVFRQMEEDVKAFWNFIKKAVEENPKGPASKGLEYLAAKMVGRWPDGSPITLYKDAPEPKANDENNFGYANDDYLGMKCPIGAHIRRVNPRDAFNPHVEELEGKKKGKAQEQSLKFVKKHRLLRRSRPYGKPLAPSMDFLDFLASDINDKDRGIYFICLQANLSRQFEFLQQTWVADPKLNQFYADPDPIMGSQALKNNEAQFTIQAEPVRQCIAGVQSFATVKGSAYFFMPGMCGLRYLAEGNW